MEILAHPSAQDSSVFRVRRIGEVRNNPIEIRMIRNSNAESSVIDNAKTEYRYDFFWDITHKKYAVLAGGVFALVFSITPNIPLLADATDVSLIPKTGDLANAFQTGDFDFSDILLFGVHLIKLAGMLAGMFYLIINVWAGIQYIIGATMDDKDAGKNTLINAFLGFALIIFSWIGVDILISFLTTD